jgi:hypothetical protein
MTQNAQSHSKLIGISCSSSLSDARHQVKASSSSSSLLSFFSCSSFYLLYKGKDIPGRPWTPIGL